MDEAADLQRQLDEANAQRAALALEIDGLQERVLQREDRIAGFTEVLHTLRSPQLSHHDSNAAMADAKKDAPVVQESVQQQQPPAAATEEVERLNKQLRQQQERAAQLAREKELLETGMLKQSTLVQALEQEASYSWR